MRRRADSTAAGVIASVRGSCARSRRGAVRSITSARRSPRARASARSCGAAAPSIPEPEHGMRRALVTLAHPQHAGMLRALRVLDDAAARHGWELRYAFPASHALLDEIGIPAERTTILPGLARWRRLAGALVLPDVLRLARLARGADVLYSTTLSTFPLCHLA